MRWTVRFPAFGYAAIFPGVRISPFASVIALPLPTLECDCQVWPILSYQSGIDRFRRADKTVAREHPAKQAK